MTRGEKHKPEQQLITVAVQLTSAELSAVSRAAAVITSSGEPAFLNAADGALRKLRDAAKIHPKLSGGTQK